jgi:glycosyltransferase involved in cell wall biosynthesis
MSTPLVSIVVPTLNQAGFIAQTLASIAGQCCPRIEVIVVDGGSTDGTAEVVKRFGSLVTRFISEPDRGQADAINKGFRAAQGDILAWLNSDDYYLPAIIDRIAPMLGSGNEPRLAYGGTVAYFQERQETTIWRAPRFDREVLKTKALIYQPSAFWTRALWEATGELNIAQHFTLDWDWFLRASAHSDFQRIDEPLSVYRFHENHKTGSGNPRRNEEICAFVERHAGAEWGAAFREVSAELTTLGPGLDRLKRFGLFRWRKLFYRALYKKHGAKVKVALSQLRV